MKRCDKCNITIITNHKYCPLCHQVLQGENDEPIKEIYPDTISVTRMILPTTKKVIMYLTIISILSLAIINWAGFNGSYWSLIPISGIIYFWFLVRVGIFSKRNIAFRLATLTVLMIGLLIFIDFDTVPDNNGWSLNYLMPLLLMSANLAISVIIWAKRLNYRDYFFYLLVIIVFSLVPIILAFVNIVTILWPSICAFLVAVSILLFIIFFFPKLITEEIQKRFHA